MLEDVKKKRKKKKEGKEGRGERGVKGVRKEGKRMKKEIIKENKKREKFHNEDEVVANLKD